MILVDKKVLAQTEKLEEIHETESEMKMFPVDWFLL